MSTDQEMLRKAADYILTLRDPQSGGFAFAKSNQPTLMATAYAIHALEFTKGLTCLSAAHRDAVVQFLTRCCRPDGTFCDPLFDASQIATTQHDESYFIHEATCFAQNALDALGAPPPLKRAFPQTLLTPSGLKKEFDSYNWSDPHLNSNRVMLWMGQFAHEVDRHGRTELLPLLDAGLDWMDAHQSPETGLWSGPVSVSLSAAMAATFHFTFFYAFRRRPLLHLERIIDSCLELQKPDGLFSRNNCVGQTCLDYDALDLLAKATLVTEYRGRDIQAAFHAARGTLLGLVNSDGGFANVKHRRMAGQCLPPPGLYHTGLKICSCDNHESNVFSTWFRLLAMALCDQFQWVDKKNNAFCFRRLPWLGCHDVAAIRRSYAKEQHAAPHTGREPHPCASVQSRQLQAAESAPEIISRELNMSLKGVSIIIISTTQSSNRLDQFLSSFFAVNTHTPVEVIIPIEVADPGNRRDIVLKYTTKAFVRPVMYTGNQPVSAVANLCASKARYNFLFFISDQSHNYKENILEETLRALDVQGIGAVSVDNTNENKLSLKNIQNKEFKKHRLSAIGVDLWLFCSKKDFQALSGFDNANSDTGIILENDRTNDASKTLTVPQKPKISIIIPVYNSEPYLRKCIDSVINQTLKDIEVIIVNDCTPDNSEEIILEYKAKDPRIVYIKHEKNLGLGGVRNTGIEAAKGEYQWHIDSDDFIDLNACEVLYGTAKKKQVDILTFSGCNFAFENNVGIYHDECFSRDKSICNKLYKGVDFFQEANKRRIFHCAIWLNLINSSFLKKFSKIFKFRENVYHQDTDYTPILYTHAKSVLCIHYTPYHRLIRDDSVTGSKLSRKKMADKLALIKSTFSYIIENSIPYKHPIVDFVMKDYMIILSIYKNEYTDDGKEFIEIIDDVNRLKSIIDNSDKNTIKIDLKYNKYDQLTIMVKTFLRPDMIERFMKSIAHYQKINNVKFSKIIIGDDSDRATQKETKEIIEYLTKNNSDINIEYQMYEYYVGCSEARNRMISSIDTDLFLYCDDDFFLDPECDFSTPISMIFDNKIDLISGWLKDYSNLSTSYNRRYSLGYFNILTNQITCTIRNDIFPDYCLADFHSNFYIAKTAKIKNIKWDSELKTEEHPDFFLRAYKNGLKMAFTNKLFAKHHHQTNPKYSELRSFEKSGKKYLYLRLKKAHMKEWITYTISLDSTKKWYINSVNNENVTARYLMGKSEVMKIIESCPNSKSSLLSDYQKNKFISCSLVS